MGKVLSGDYSGCSIRANKKSLKIEYISASPLNKHNIINVIKANCNQVRVQFINNGGEKESVLDLTDNEYEVLMAVLAEQAEHHIEVLKPAPKSPPEPTQSKPITRKCITCNEVKNIELYPNSTARKCNECREKDAKRAEEARLRYEAELAEALKYGKFCGGGFCVEGVYNDLDRIRPFSAFRKDKRFKDGYADWCIQCEKGREEYYEHIFSGGTASTFRQLKSASGPFPNPIRSTHTPSNPKKSGFWATIKSALGLKGEN
ncbi:hypothetical protein SAMN05444673_3383 [Bacillus sp. OV166]|uniref:hypothetical protein n=1 Tax=Bacillus sp. OV166 TaxID=1882763 RepID=UPI000A2AA9F4|nr:hypothetical protein [Bacillus sp. OV166]SMQ78354.1 hypothetical protein SAMN05444673_3383 [Bacillus sp. OV166]